MILVRMWLLCVAIFLCLFNSCNISRDNRKNISKIEIDSEKKSEKSVLNVSRFIILDDDEDAIFSDLSKVMCDGERIFILDGNLSTIHVFSMSGKQLGKIDNIGQGPGEYVRLRDFDVKDNKIYLYDDMNRRILCYNLSDYKYEESVQTSFFARAFSLLENGNILFVLPKDQGHKQVVVTDPNCNIMSEYIDFEEDDLDNQTRYSLLQKTGRGLVYSKPLQNDVYIFSSRDGHLLEEYLFLIDGKEFSDENFDSPNLRTTPLILNDGTILGNYLKGRESFFYQKSLNSDRSWVRGVLRGENHYSDLLLPLCVSGDSLILSYLVDEVYQKMDKTLPLESKYEEYLENGGFLITTFRIGE